MTEETLICICCEEEIDPNFAMYSSSVDGEPLCETCFDGDLQHAATIYYIQNGEVEKMYAGHYVTMTEYGDPVTKFNIDSKWVSTSSSWRGYHDVSLNGFINVLEGWTTGAHDDEVGRRKSHFNFWVQDLCDGVEQPPVPVALIFATTSNLFSTAVTVQVAPTDETSFKEWLGDNFDLLHEALS